MKTPLKISDFYKPFPRQAEFHANPAKYRLFGGQAGPGKSMALLWEAIAYCLGVPGCNALLLRRTFPRLKQGLIDHFLKYIPPEIYGGIRNFNITDHVVTFPSATVPSKLWFGQNVSAIRAQPGWSAGPALRQDNGGGE